MIDLDEKQKAAMRESLTAAQQATWLRAIMAHGGCYLIASEGKQYSEDPSREQGWRAFFEAAAKSESTLHSVVHLASCARTCHPTNLGAVLEAAGDLVADLHEQSTAMVVTLGTALEGTPLHDMVLSMLNADDAVVSGLVDECRRHAIRGVV